MHYWVQATPSDFSGSLPQPRSGHSAVSIGKSKIVVFGGLVDKKFLSDIVVYDIENKVWFQPTCTGSGSEGHIGPSPRAFHVAVAIDCHMFIFGGRSGSRRMGDFWVLDTDIWQWSELTSFGDLPSSRDFAAASSIGNCKIVMYGGWDGKKWLSDVYVLDTISLEWAELSVTGSLPPPRCGHSATMVEKRLLVYGGRGGGGPIMGDLWALKGLTEENEMPGWTQLKLPGQAPSARCGHTVTSGGHYLLLFGGHGTGGWLSRYDIYYNDCIILDRVSAQWKRLSTGNEPPPARAYHSMTYMGSRYLLFGGFDGKSTFGDIWWLVPEDDPIAKRYSLPPPKSLAEDKQSSSLNEKGLFMQKDMLNDETAITELQRRLGISVSLPGPDIQVVDESEDKEFIELGLRLIGARVSSDGQDMQTLAVQSLRNHWKKALPSSMRLKELGPLLRDYQRLITRHHLTNGDLRSIEAMLTTKAAYRFYHMKNASQVKKKLVVSNTNQIHLGDNRKDDEPNQSKSQFKVSNNGTKPVCCKIPLEKYAPQPQNMSSLPVRPLSWKGPHARYASRLIQTSQEQFGIRKTEYQEKNIPLKHAYHLTRKSNVHLCASIIISREFSVCHSVFEVQTFRVMNQVIAPLCRGIAKGQTGQKMARPQPRFNLTGIIYWLSLKAKFPIHHGLVKLVQIRKESFMIS